MDNPEVQVAVVDFREFLPPVGDQGRRGTCVAFAGTAAHELIRRDGERLAEEYLHWAAKQRDKLPSHVEGTTLRAAAVALAEVGQPAAEYWPYDEQRDPHSRDYVPSAAAQKDALLRRVSGGGAVPLAPAAIKSALDEGRAVVLGIRLYATWFLPASSGEVTVPTPNAVSLGGHAVLVVGYRADEKFVIRNSWGSSWGDAGYGTLPFALVEAHGVEAWLLGEPDERSRD